MGRRNQPPPREDTPASPSRTRALGGEPATPDPATLGDLAAAGLAVFCWCNRCSHHSELSSAVLAAQLGPATPVPALARRLRCAGCGGRDVAARPAWPARGPVSRHL